MKELARLSLCMILAALVSGPALGQKGFDEALAAKQMSMNEQWRKDNSPKEEYQEKRGQLLKEKQAKDLAGNFSKQATENSVDIKEEDSKQKEEQTGARSLANFNIIHENNIFDPNRRPDRPQRQRERRPVRPRPQNEHIELLGVMIDEEKSVAFFECSNSAFSGVCEQGEEVAGFFLMEVDPAGVTLEQEDLQKVLPVGSRLNKGGDQEWRVVDAPYRSIDRTPLISMASSRNNRNSNSRRGNDRGRDAADQFRQRIEDWRNSASGQETIDRFRQGMESWRNSERGQETIERIQQGITQRGGIAEIMRGMRSGRGGGR